MSLKRLLVWIVAVLPWIACGAAFAAPDEERQATLERILERLEALERQNEQLTRQVEALTRQNQALAQDARPASAGVSVQTTPVAATTAASPSSAAQADAPDEWASRIRFKGDLRYRHENIDSEAAVTDRTRDTLRARFGAQIAVTDAVEAEIAIATGGRDPRGGSATLGAASSRKDIGLDLGYVSWRALQDLTLIAGKMRQPFARPGMSAFIDNEIRPEGLAATYQGPFGLFGSAFRFWLEERSGSGESMLSGGQIGWQQRFGDARVQVGGGYYDYGSVQGRFPGFGDGIGGPFGNTVEGDAAAARYAFDYDIAQVFAEGTLPIAGIPVTLFADYARNTAVDDLDTAYNVGFIVGKANAPGRWEAGAFTQQVEKDALFGQWLDSDFAGGVTDNKGQVYRIGWMALRNLLVNLTYFDSQFNVDVGDQTDYRRWQLEANFTF